MADVLGTVVGVISFGLQVCSGIAKYLDGIEGHRDEIASATRLCETLQGLLDDLQARRNDIATASHGNPVAIERAMASANAELGGLRAFVDEVRISDDPSKSFSEWIKDRTRRTVYPFRRPRLGRLETQLSEANKMLQTALQVVQFEISIETGNLIRSIGDEVSTTRTELNHKLDNLHQVSTKGHHTLGKLSDDFSQLSLSLETFVPHAQRHIEASSVQFTRMESRMEEVLSALASTDSEIVLRRVLTKPDALRLACTEVGIGHRYSHSLNSPPTVPQHGAAKTSMFGCRCHPRRVRRQRKEGFRSVFMTAESLEETVHAPYCPLAGVSPSQKSWTLGLSTKVFRTILSTAITVSTSSTFGAGGFSICPSFRIYFVRNASPAEAIIHTIQRSASLGDEDFALVLRKGIRALEWIFKSGKASPLDLNTCGSNLLNKACDGFWSDNAFALWRLNPLLRFLVALGVPRNHADKYEQLPFQSLFDWSAHFLDSVKVRTSDTPRYEGVDFTSVAVDHQFLMPDDTSVISDYAGGVSITPAADKFYRKVSRAIPEMTKCYGNALHAAIRRKDEVTLVEILKKDTGKAILWENDIFGYASVELLASWNRGLELALFHCGAQILQPDEVRMGSLLSFALNGSQEICSVSSPARCPQNCVCADDVVMLLEAGCLIELDSALLLFVLEASTRCQEAVIGHLKKRREELANLALNRLSPTEIKHFGISTDTVLDIQTHEVVHALKRRNVEVPQLLQTQVVINYTFPPWSLYHLISWSNTSTDTRHLLNIIHSHGFGEIDVPDATGFTPSMMTSRPLTFINLVKMGADPTRQIPGSVAGFTTTHQLFGDCGGSMARKEDIRMMIEVKENMQLLHAFPSEDECTCECTVNGCHPYSATCKRITRYDICYDNNWRKQLDWILDSMASLSDGLWDMPEDFKLIALRMATFVSLSIRHTCCDSEGKAIVIDDDDIQEFGEEDSRAIETLHSLLPQFETKLADANCSFLEFMATVWKTRMEQVLADVYEPQHLTEDNLRQIMEMGVNLQVEVEVEDNDEVRPKHGTLEYHMAELDKIMEEIGV